MGVCTRSAYKEEDETDKDEMTGCLFLCGMRSLE